MGDTAEVTIRRDLLEDGTWDETSVYFTDAEGRTLLSLSYPDEDDALERVEYTLDAEGNVVERVDSRRSSIGPVAYRTTYDDEGRPILEETDALNDGTIDAVTTWDYSTPGRTVRSWDQNLDGEPDTIYTWTYSENGAVIREEWDREADGTVDMVTSYSYTDGGLLLEKVEDWEGESESDFAETNEYDDRGLLVRSTWVGYGFDQVRTYEYDEAGHLLRTNVDSGGDGTTDGIFRNVYDEKGRLLRSDVLHLPAESVQGIHEYEYGETDEPIRTTSDADGDGDPDSVITRSACP